MLPAERRAVNYAGTRSPLLVLAAALTAECRQHDGVDADRLLPAIDLDVRAMDPARAIGDEKRRHVGHIFGAPEPAEGRLAHHVGVGVRMGVADDVPHIALPPGRAGRERVDANAVAAKLLLVTWDGELTDSIGVNERNIVKNIGGDHDLSYDEIKVPLMYLRTGVNVPYTYSATGHHGIEVNWPGIALKVVYEFP